MIFEVLTQVLMEI